MKEQRTVELPAERYPSANKFNQGSTQPLERMVFTTKSLYDSFGRLHRLTYPDGETVTYGYNAGGLPSKVSGSYKGNSYDYVSALGYDEFEQRVHLSLGNGATTNYSYKPDSRRLDTLISTSQGTTFQKLSYGYDNVGNVTRLLNDVPATWDGMGGRVNLGPFQYDSLDRLTEAAGSYERLGQKESYTLAMTYDTNHNILRKNQVHTITGSDGKTGTKHGTTYDWSYQYTGTQPHAPTKIGVLDSATQTITGRLFSYDKNGNQTGWTDDKNANTRKIVWDDENRIQSIDDKGGEFSQYSYGDQGQRLVKQARSGTTVYVNQFFTERNGSIGSKHVFVGETRIVTKVTGGTNFIRSYDGMTGAKTTPPEKTKTIRDPLKPGKATDKSNNGNHFGQLDASEKENNGKKPERANDKGDKRNGNGDHPGQGLEHRSDRANEVAQNTCKNKHLLQYCDEDGDGVPDTENTSGDDGAVIGGDTTETASSTPTLSSGDVVKISTGEQLFYYHTDHLGSTGYVTRENGEVHEHIQYFPFGETWVQQGGNTEKSPYLYTSKEFDEETGLYYFGSRYYDPRTSVWTSADRILGRYLDGAVQGVERPINFALYTYGRNNPIVYKDPDGNAAALGVVGIVGAGLALYGAFESGFAVGTAGVQIYTGEKTVGDAAKEGAVTVGTNAAVSATGLSLFKVANRVVPDEVKKKAIDVAREKLAEARKAREALSESVKDLSAKKRPATVTAGYNTETGEVAARACGGGRCAEDHVVDALGGDKSKVRFTEATRPRKGNEVPVCERCEATYGRDPFPEGTQFKSDQ